MLKTIRLAITQPAHALERLRYSWFLKRIQRHGNVAIHRSAWLRGIPLIDIGPGASLRIGSGVHLDSKNRGYHLNMYGPVKLMADTPAARITIGNDTRIHGSCLHATTSIEVGNRVLIAANCQIIDSHGHDLCLDDPQNRIYSRDEGRPIVIEDNVWIGAGCIIMPGVTIGEGAVIGAQSVVTKSIPPRVVAGGSPARVIRT
jgi:acetyltransferase-like isoleucine patch superfamily enzyme